MVLHNCERRHYGRGRRIIKKIYCLAMTEISWLEIKLPHTSCTYSYYYNIINTAIVMTTVIILSSAIALILYRIVKKNKIISSAFDDRLHANYLFELWYIRNHTTTTFNNPLINHSPINSYNVVIGSWSRFSVHYDYFLWYILYIMN